MYENVALVFWRYEWPLLALCASKSGPAHCKGGPEKGPGLTIRRVPRRNRMASSSTSGKPMLFQATVARARINHGAGYEPNPLFLGPACSGPGEALRPPWKRGFFLVERGVGRGLGPKRP